MTAKRRIIRAISPRTDAEWPIDHPLREGTVVLLDSQIPDGSFLICADAGTPREPLPPDDHDMTGTCAHCRRPIVWRASASEKSTRICFACWGEIAS